MRLVWDDDDYIEAWNDIMTTGSRSPVKDLAERAGVKHHTAAQRMMRLRRKGLVTVNGNIARGSGNCPQCGAPPSAQRQERRARRQEAGLSS